VDAVDDDWVDLADAVRVLRRELDAAAAERPAEGVHFEVGPVEVEFAVKLTRDVKAGGGVRLGIVSIGVKGGMSSDSSHRLKLVLTPKDVATGRAPEISTEIDGIPDR
jgi:hypothetical protein